jgi:antitoxin CcdA
MNYAHKRFPKKKAVNLSLSEDLIETAKKNGINLSDFVERRIERELRTLKLQKWADENKDAIQERNQMVESEGCFGEKYGVMFNSED